MTQPAISNLIPLKELPEYIPGLSLSTAAHWRQQGTGPAFAKIGRRIYYSRESVEKWIADQFKNETGE